MELFVNGEKLDVTLENEKTVGDVLTSFEQTCEKNSLATVGIKLNGHQIEASAFDKASAVPLSADTKIELTVVAEKNVADTFISLGTVFQTIADKLKNIPALLQSGKDSETGSIISELADALDQFCHTAALSALFPDIYGNLKIDNKPVSQFFSDFSGVLTDFKKALETKDTVTIGDLAEYEICPRLEAISEAVKSIHGSSHE